MRRLLSAFLILVFMFISIPISSTVKAENKFDGYIPISTADELANIANDTTAKYYLTKDIDMASYGYWETIKEFTGVLDGNGHVIRNLSITRNSENGYGAIFGATGDAVVRNLSLQNISYKIVENKDYMLNNSMEYVVGGIAGFATNTIIENCNVSGTIAVDRIEQYQYYNTTDTFVLSGNTIGGIVGWAVNGTSVKRCYTNINITNNNEHTLNSRNSKGHLEITNSIGGIVGKTGMWPEETPVNISESFGVGEAISSNVHLKFDQNMYYYMEANNYVGGVVGYVDEKVELENCFSTSKIDGIATTRNLYRRTYKSSEGVTNNYLGGIAGYLNGKLSNSYSSGKMEKSDNSKIGGVVGFADTNAYIYRAYYLRNNSQKIKFNSEIAGVGDNTMAANATATSLDEAKMQKQTNFKDWDFKSTWQIVKGINKGYPIFKTNTKAFQLSKVTANVKAGTYKKSFSVKLSSATPDTKIYYTTDGTKPTTKSKAYTKALSIKKSTTLKVLVVRNGFQSSPVATYKYVIKK
ncbi:hypothetical protein HNQ56_000164 [Anaerotaenia torta]|uniref:chitobiase/beta-hexosaminidase C-terminal domain-containing protein n=1 Tax=Anaerotaenia torta TaxID=433293 RepID=UPI003D1BC821